MGGATITLIKERPHMLIPSGLTFLYSLALLPRSHKLRAERRRKLPALVLAPPACDHAHILAVSLFAPLQLGKKRFGALPIWCTRIHARDAPLLPHDPIFRPNPSPTRVQYEGRVVFAQHGRSPRRRG